MRLTRFRRGRRHEPEEQV
uniref:Uncharacterized protein n=1 Tax=Arundo donax TaxID=35708 RepID=A0A0A9BEA0_ARUDO